MIFGYSLVRLPWRSSYFTKNLQKDSPPAWTPSQPIRNTNWNNYCGEELMATSLTSTAKGKGQAGTERPKRSQRAAKPSKGQQITKRLHLIRRRI